MPSNYPNNRVYRMHSTHNALLIESHLQLTQCTFENIWQRTESNDPRQRKWTNQWKHFHLWLSHESLFHPHPGRTAGPPLRSHTYMSETPSNNSANQMGNRPPKEIQLNISSSLHQMFAYLILLRWRMVAVCKLFVLQFLLYLNRTGAAIYSWR